jgi:hypothetical protein
LKSEKPTEARLSNKRLERVFVYAIIQNMRVRQLTASLDYSYGQGSANYLVDSRQAVAQEVQTTLLLFQGEWFLDVTSGVPWLTQVVGVNTIPLYDQVIKNAILNVQGVTGIVNYVSTLNRATRALAVTATIDTQFGITQIQATLPTVAVQ